MFWIFGHPEVYILILPAFGIVSEIIPVFARKPLFGYPFMVFSGIAIGFMGWGVWAHHMFASGLGPISVAVFSATTMFIAVPTGVKIINWLATMWGGSLSFTTAMCFAIGLVVEFTIGGLSGVTHAVSPSDTQQTDTYYIVAHFHYVLFGGAVFPIFGALYYWLPKMTGKLMNERLGKLSFWLIFIGFQLTHKSTCDGGGGLDSSLPLCPHSARWPHHLAHAVHEMPGGFYRVAPFRPALPHDATRSGS
jgi:cytochrome c oxidase subunit 1